MPYLLKGCLALLLAVFNVVIVAVPFFTVVLLKLLVPQASIRKVLTAWVTFWGRQYNRNNVCIFSLMGRIDWRINGLDQLAKHGSYLVVANHQSWADIPILQGVIEPRAPMLKFFIKKELIYVPVLGAAWWALDFPFMKRYSKEFLARHPEKRGEDVAETRKMCERFKDSPVCVMSFVEGTRFSPTKAKRQGSGYQNLLQPKAGGVALVMNAMGQQIDTLIDVTINYHQADQTEQGVTIWQLFSGQLKRISIDIQAYPIPKRFCDGDYEHDAALRADIQAWISDIWQRKDQILSA